MVERTWIHKGGYGRFRGEWVKEEGIIQNSRSKMADVSSCYLLFCKICIEKLGKARRLESAPYSSVVYSNQPMMFPVRSLIINDVIVASLLLLKMI